MKYVYFDDLDAGDSWTSSPHIVDEAEMVGYAKRYDPRPVHIDPEAAAKSPFRGLIASGGYMISLQYLLGQEITCHPDHYWKDVVAMEETTKVFEPVRAGDRLHQRVTILEKRPTRDPGRGIVKERVEAINQHDRVVMSMDLTFAMACRKQAIE